MSILTPHNKSHTAGPQSSPSHMEALRRIRQAYQRQLEQMQITHVLDTRGSDFLTVNFWESKHQAGQEVWLDLHACLGREEIRRLSGDETKGVRVVVSCTENYLLSFPVMWEVWGATSLTQTYMPIAESGAGIACVRWHSDGLSAWLLSAISQAGRREAG